MADGSAVPFWGRRRVTSILQTEATECALACLTMIANYHGHQIDLASLRRRFPVSTRGATLARIIEISHALGFDSRPMRAELGYLAEVKTPCILHWDLNHFVVLESATSKRIRIHDPARGTLDLPLESASKHFTGILLELKPSTSFEPKIALSKFRLRDLTGRIMGLKRILAQGLGLALAIELLGLLAPFQMQLVIDNVLSTLDVGFLVLAAIGFICIAIVQMGLNLAQGWIVSWLGAALSSQWINNLFGHLMRLPLDFFEKRNIGDILSRFNSVRAIQSTLTGSFIEVVLDGLMGFLALLVLILYSPTMAGVVVFAVVIYALLRYAMYRRLWKCSEEQLAYGARQQTELIESIRGVQTIKLANKQAERSAKVAKTTIEAAHRDLQIQRITLAFGAINKGVFGVHRVFLISVGALLAMRGSFSAGMLVAFISYADQFTSKVATLVDKIVDFKMLRLHAHRIADVALAEPERYANGGHSESAMAPCIRLKDVSFRYSEYEPWVLRGVNITINAGESVAIVGPSGCGKSTLAKIMLGLLEPTEGLVEIDGIDIRGYGLRNYRSMIGAVMQDDQLFTGSIADNISFSDKVGRVSMDNIVAAARSAAIHDEITAMPMGYETLVGDMGSSLSGGQRQRIILARALFSCPKVLLLDEATSHLDESREKEINAHIKAMNLTRIIIAHRQETVRSAQRVVEVQAGPV